MKVDTTSLQDIANRILYQQANYSFSKSSLQNRHAAIQYKLSALANYLISSANSIQQMENNLTTSFHGSQIQFTHSENWNAISQMQKKNVTSDFKGTIHASYKSLSIDYNGKYVDANADINIGDVKATGDCSVSLWKNGQFNPTVAVQAQVDASLVSAHAYTRIGGKNVYATASAQGMAGVAYANAKAIVSLEEQTLDLGVGVAALRGSCSCTFTVFNAKITLTGSGSIGSAEANLSYSFKNREWEIGSKLGFICGLGFKVKVSY